jgi:ABC-2 type transport system ATP-binding protein
VTDTPTIATKDLVKNYDGVEALAGVDLVVPQGSICGLLGRNGAGKTTTLKILLGMTFPTRGTAQVFGLAAVDPAASVAIRRRTAFVSDEKELWEAQTVAQLIRLTAQCYPRWRNDLEQDYVRRFELPADRVVKHLSRGMRTRLALTLALATGAELLLLDEPTSGLDPAASEEVLQALVTHAARTGATVLLSSHHLHDVEQIADRVAIIDRGRMVTQGSLDDLRASYCRIQLVFDGAAPETKLGAPGVVAVRRDGRVLSVLSSAGADQLIAETRALRPLSVDVAPVTLKEIFLETVGTEH